MTVTRTSHRIVVALIAALAFGVAVSAADEGLARAKELYLSAAYEDALTVLDGLKNDGPSADATEAAEYRVFCLLALQRSADAKKAIEAMVTANPFYQPSEAQVSPRIRAVFHEVRQGLIPSIVQRSYADAKAAFDRKDPQTSALFDRLLVLLDDPDVKAQPAIADLRMLSIGFRDLSKAIPAPPAQPPFAAASTSSSPAVPPPVPPQAPQSAPAAVASSESPARGPVPVVVTPPVAVFQQMPRWTPPLGEPRQEYKGTLEVMIDEQGNVASATILQATTPVYDAELIKAARTWKFRPALTNGVPTRYKKLIEVQLRPGPR